MVRRWSYINSLNVFNKSKYDTHRQAAFGATVRATMYFRGEFTVPTSLTRRRWSRRKHIYGWLTLSNILKEWAQLYRFNRNHTKFLLRQHFTKSTFIAFNTVSARNSLPCLHKGSELVVVSSVSKKVLHYFSKFSNPRIRFLLSFKNVNLSCLSFSSKYWDLAANANNDYSPILVQDSLNVGMQPLLKHSAANALQQQNSLILTNILQLTFKNALKITYHVYRIITFIVLTSIK